MIDKVLIMHAMLNVALKAARKAGDVIVKHLDRIDSLTIQQKRQKDFVSEVDKLAEKEIINIIQKTYPNHQILAEESGQLKGNDEYVWIIDPLDGTTNFLHNIPHFAVSIAFQFKGKLQHGLVYDPVRQEIFSASRGAGARLNDRRIRVSQRHKFEEAIIGTGLPFREPENFKVNTPIINALFGEVRNLRIMGAAALDLAYVAAGRLDGFWEMSLQEWDIAAGALIIQEAGGLVSDMLGADHYLQNGHVVAGNPKVFKMLVQITEKAMKENG